MQSVKVKRLGEGGFGAIYEVTDQKTRKSQAMKVESTKETDQLLRLEVEVLRRLQRKSTFQILP